jgi:GntR family carbon starvation induced transcriptional regulator
LRESLSCLVVEGLVVGEDRRGFRVAPMTEADLPDLPQDIELLAVTTSVRRGDDLWEADLVRAFRHMKLLTPGSPNYLVERSTRHQASRETLGSACGSPRLLHLRRQLVDQFMRYQRIAPRHVACSAVHDTDHKKLLDATLARDSRKCEALIRAHIRMLDVIVEAVRPLNKR